MNIRLIFSIIFTLTILISSIFLWKNLNKNYNLIDSFAKEEKQVITMKDIDVCSDKDSNKLLGYNFIIDSDYDTNKNYNVQIISGHINNDDIHYTIDNGEIMSLSEDNVILRKNINANDKHSYIFKVWLTNDYEDNDIDLLINFE